MRTKAGDIFIYKVVVDNGGAPCVHKGLLSLAICKPKIRKSAGIDSLIFGFGGRDYGERLIYVARVTGKLEGPKYYTSREYAGRRDRIYRRLHGKAELLNSAQYHTEDDLQKDVGRHFENASVLLSDDFRYFGANGTADYKNRYQTVKQMVEMLGQGHRRNHEDGLRSALVRMKCELWKKFQSQEVGEPTEQDFTKRCNKEADFVIC